MAIIKEFKEFAMKGNVLDLAIGVIIGAAFGKIIASFVNDIIMPLISLLIGKVDFTNLFVSFDGKTYETMQMAKDAGAVTLNYGQFITTVVDFLIVAFAIFIVIRQINKLKPKEAVPAAVVTTKACPFCQSTVSINAIKCPYCTSDLK